MLKRKLKTASKKDISISTDGGLIPSLGNTSSISKSNQYYREDKDIKKNSQKKYK